MPRAVLRASVILLVMRIVPMLFVMGVAAPAYAETGASFDFGYAHSRVAVTDNTALNGHVGRFAIRLSTGRHLHFGAEAEEGWISGTTSLPNGTVAKGEVQPQELDGPLEGNTLALKVFAGLHANSGALRFSGDVAGGMRDTWVSSDAGMDVAGRKKEPLVELRTRVDFRMSPSTTIGAVAATDLRERRDVSLGLVFALDFTQ